MKQMDARFQEQHHWAVLYTFHQNYSRRCCKGSWDFGAVDFVGCTGCTWICRKNARSPADCVIVL